MLNDLRYAVRSLIHRPGLSAAVILVLSLGLGTVTAVFSILDRALVRPLATDGNGSRWTLVVIDRGQGNGVNSNLSHPLFADVRDRSGAFDRVLAHSPVSLTLRVGDEVERLDAGAVSAGFFGALGLALPLGREILPVEDRPGAAEHVVVLSHSLWQRRFAGDRAVLGRPISLNGDPYTVVGVAPEGFLGPVRGTSQAAWIPVTASTTAGTDAFTRRTVSWLDVMARLAPGIDSTRAQSGLDLLAAQLAKDSLFSGTSRLTIADGSTGLSYLVGGLQRPLATLFGASVLVLLIAGANLAGLLLARATTRQRELSIRLSLGASRWRIARLFLTEGFVLAILGAAGGLLVATWIGSAAPALRTLFGQELQLSGGLDLRAAALSGGLALLLAALIAASPAAWASTLELSRGLKDGGGPGAPGGAMRGRLVVTQLALAVVLVVGGVTFGVTTRRLAAVNPGYRADGVMLAEVDLDAKGYRRAQAGQFWENVIADLANSPQVAGVSVAQIITPSPGGIHYDQVPLQGSATPPAQVEFDLNMVGPGYFNTLEIPVKAGRAFTLSDRMGSEPVAVVNQAMVRRYWAGQSPIGRRMWLDSDTTKAGTTVIGPGRKVSEPPGGGPAGGLPVGAAGTAHDRNPGRQGPVRRVTRQPGDAGPQECAPARSRAPGLRRAAAFHSPGPRQRHGTAALLPGHDVCGPCHGAGGGRVVRPAQLSRCPAHPRYRDPARAGSGAGEDPRAGGAPGSGARACRRDPWPDPEPRSQPVDQFPALRHFALQSSDTDRCRRRDADGHPERQLVAGRPCGPGRPDDRPPVRVVRDPTQEIRCSACPRICGTPSAGCARRRCSPPSWSRRWRSASA
jgi:putative ABC transport system permease protein